MSRDSSSHTRPPLTPKPPSRDAGRDTQGQRISSQESPPLVRVRWLLAAITATILLAACCVYGALCLLFYQGQWQMLFHPSRAVTRTPASAGIPFNDIRFDVNEAGIPQLDGWWIPAVPKGSYTADTILYLHDSRGSLSDTVPALASLHELGINIFAIDYRGFGLSKGKHPTERLATDDAGAAWTYLTDIRHIPARHLIVFGEGVGATFAAHLAVRFAPAGIVLENPNLTARQVFASDARARVLPLFLLQKEKLDPAGDLARAHIPRLFLAHGADGGRAHQLFAVSSYPKQYFELSSASAREYSATLRRFLDQVLH